MANGSTNGKRIDIAEDIRANPTLNRLIPAARDALQEEVGRSFEQLSEEWRLIRDERGRLLITLKVTDPWGDGEVVFAPDELENPVTVHRRMNRLWGDVLQKGSKAMRAKFETMTAATAED
jgi:hypothetical protein